MGVFFCLFTYNFFVMNCFVKFNVTDSAQFKDLKNVFEAFKKAKSMCEPQKDIFWLNIFPDYALKHFSFLNSDIKPANHSLVLNEFTWHFYSLIELLSVNYEIEYVDCFKLSDNQGQLEYYPYSYPYGGITGLIVFLKAFNCVPTLINDGTSLYAIDFLNNGDFSITDLNDPKKQSSKQKLFDGLELLKQFARNFAKS